MDEEMMDPGMPPDQMAAPEGEEKFGDVSPEVRAAVEQMRTMIDDPQMDPILQSMIVDSADLTKAVGAVLALLVTGIGPSMGVEPDDVVDVMAHIAADLIELAADAGIEEAQDPSIASAVMEEAVRLIQSGAGGGEQMAAPEEGPMQEAPAAPRKTLYRPAMAGGAP